MTTQAQLVDDAPMEPAEVLLMEKVNQLEAVIGERRAWQEENRRMAPRVVEALSEAGLWGIFKPVELGGLECNPVVALKVFEEMSRIEPSVGWAIANQAGLDILGVVLPEQGAKDAYANPARPVAGGWSPPGQATPVEGGYRVTGRWPFASNCHYAQYLTGMTVVVDGGEPRTNPDGSPVLMVVFFPPDEAEIIDTWHTMGMRGTGSHDISVHDVYVPDRFCWIVSPVGVERSGPFRSPLYNAFPWLMFACLGPVGLGVGQAAIDELIRLAGQKTPSYTDRCLRNREVAQSNVARAQAAIGAARAYLHQAVERVHRTAQAGVKPTLRDGLEVQLAACNALEAGSRVLNLVQDTVGTSGIRQEQRFEQLYRDGRTISQHAFASLSRYESCGKVLFGLPSD